MVDVIVDPDRDTYAVQFTGYLLDQTPEALTASIQMAFQEIRGWRHCLKDEVP